MWWILLVAFGAVSVLLLLWPLWRNPESWEPETVDASALNELKQQKFRLMRFLKDLELERETETLTEDDYQEQWDQYAREVARINQRLEALTDASRVKRADSNAGEASAPAKDPEDVSRKTAASAAPGGAVPSSDSELATADSESSPPDRSE